MGARWPSACASRGATTATPRASCSTISSRRPGSTGAGECGSVLREVAERSHGVHGGLWHNSQTGLVDGSLFEDVDSIVERARASGIRVLPQAPSMHATGHAAALGMWNAGGTVVIPDVAEKFDPVSILRSMEREKANLTVFVGDAMARPLVERLPHVTVIEGVGSSETGGQASNVSHAGTGVASGSFAPGRGTAVLSEDRLCRLAPGDEEVGWLARSGAIPLGYLGDEQKTREAFPVVEGIRCVVPGDRARWTGDASVEFLGRESTKMNSGGEKIFAEEVEAALEQHPAALDAAVAGRPSERWGEEVVAVVQLREGQHATRAALLEECGKHVARFKLPKAILFRDEIRRGNAAKIDLAWLLEEVRASRPILPSDPANEETSS